MASQNISNNINNSSNNTSNTKCIRCTTGPAAALAVAITLCTITITTVAVERCRAKRPPYRWGRETCIALRDHQGTTVAPQQHAHYWWPKSVPSGAWQIAKAVGRTRSVPVDDHHQHAEGRMVCVSEKHRKTPKPFEPSVCQLSTIFWVGVGGDNETNETTTSAWNWLGGRIDRGERVEDSIAWQSPRNWRNTNLAITAQGDVEGISVPGCPQKANTQTQTQDTGWKMAHLQRTR